MVGELCSMDSCYSHYLYACGITNLKEINMFEFIAGLFVGSILGILAAALCVAARRGDDHGQSD